MLLSLLEVTPNENINNNSSIPITFSDNNWCESSKDFFTICSNDTLSNKERYESRKQRQDR